MRLGIDCREVEPLAAVAADGEDRPSSNSGDHCSRLEGEDRSRVDVGWKICTLRLETNPWSRGRLKSPGAGTVVQLS
jgi:hypothetical protein